MIITGSRIARPEFQSVSPIISIDREEITLTGVGEINTLLNDLPHVDPGLGSGTGNNEFGYARLNLRGLGDIRTLVLLNGRRYANDTIFGAANLNYLPPVLIERVEVITGGASAVYGSDAVAGAVNFVLRNDFEGFEGNIQYGLTEQGDGDTFNANAAFGTELAGGRGNIAVFADYYSRSAVFQDAREYSAEPLFGNNDTGELEPNLSIFSDAGLIFGAQPYTFSSTGVPRPLDYPADGYNFAPSYALWAPMERYAASALGHFDITDALTVRMELLHARATPEQRRDSAFSQSVTVTIDRPDITPELRELFRAEFDPDGDGIAEPFFGRRFTLERGPVVNRNDRTFNRAMVGFDGRLGQAWEWSADFTYTHADNDQKIYNDTSSFRVQQGLLVDPDTGECVDPSGGCVPVNPFGADSLSTAAAEFIGLETVTSDEQVTQEVLTIALRGPLLSLRAGDLDVAVGAEYRRDDIRYVPSEALANGDSVFLGPYVPVTGDIAVRELFAEARIPLFSNLGWAEYLGLEVGLRASDYDIIDETLWTWKAGGDWQMPAGVRLRAMAQRAIRVPSVSELYQEAQPLGTSFNLGLTYDQCSASRDPVGSGVADLCIAQGIPADQIGVFEAEFYPTAVDFVSNPDLDAEKADTLTVGVVWQPAFAQGLSTSFDYFRIEIDNGVDLLAPEDFIPLCFITRDPDDKFCSTFSRDASGNIDSARVTFVNAAQIRSEGFDVAFDYAWDTERFGLFGARARFGVSSWITYYLEAGSRPSPLAPLFDCAGRFGGACNNFVYQGALPDLRTNTRFTYASGPFTASLRWTRIGELRNSENELREATGQPPGTLAVPKVPAYDYFDLTLGADIGERWNLRFGIVNLLDKQPPLMATGSFGSANTDPRTYDTLGRRFFLRVTSRL